MIMVLNLAAFAPIAELRKFTASLLTPTHKSKTAKRNKKTTNPKNIESILLNFAAKINALYEGKITNMLHFCYKNSNKRQREESAPIFYPHRQSITKNYYICIA